MKEHGPWKIKPKTEVYSDPWIKVRKDEVLQPSGQKGIHSLVSIKPGISIIALDKDNYVYLIKEFKYALGGYSIEAVGGGIDDKDNSAKEAAKRELKEEVGIKAEKIVDLGEYNPLTEQINSPQRLFLAQKLNFKDQELDENEKIEIKKIKLSQAIDKVMNSDITEGKTCGLILKIDKYLQNEKK